MICSASSDRYTGPAIDSFLKHTKLGPNDTALLIDNDSVGKYKDKNLKLIENVLPQSFARNINDAIAHAYGRDVVILSNDIEFTQGWNEPLGQYNNLILLPSCNQTHLYTSTNQELKLTRSMHLTDYNNNQLALADCVKQHCRQITYGFFEHHLMPFYAFRLPADVINKVGLFDTDFGLGGGEDVDYRMRTIAAGFSVKYSSRSYLLHYHGKSTWDGAETQKQTQLRDHQYFQHFTDKWGEEWANLLLSGGNAMPVIEKYNLQEYFINNNYTELIKKVLQIKNIVL
jgi:glycosyltransferase involved in cell wall biosynthesis